MGLKPLKCYKGNLDGTREGLVVSFRVSISLIVLALLGLVVVLARI